MKLYLITHEGKSYLHNLCSWVDIEPTKEGGINIKSIRAFTKRKYAKEYLEMKGYKHLIIKSVDVN